MNASLIIAAGGSGQRFLKDRKKNKSQGKLFSDLGGRPLLTHTLNSFRGISQIKEVILAVPKGKENWIQKHVLAPCRLRVPIRLVPGGKTRAESVWKALQKSSPQYPWVLVHDGARPFPPSETVSRLFQEGDHADGVILARPVIPTLKRVASGNGQILGTVDRQNLYEAETPQLVRRSVLLKAYRENPKALLATDESSLIESLGGKMKVLPHSGLNLKVTLPEDLDWAKSRLLQNVPSQITLGFGRDTHRLVPGRPLYLGGVRIPFKKGSLGHSDGDALLHALADALLGATGLGDIGDWFPPSNPRYKNMRSEEFLKRILKAIEKKGWQPERVDSVILLERPKLGAYKTKIRKKIAQILNLAPESVSIKAKTQEGLGPEGEGLAVTAEALAQLRRAN